ncbi:septum formation family protein [Streptomyces pathocidini]|uniref:Septum formation family protein n=1 Tax=Streptomyces pathocidini TaxID=1650571 RepID=A0ABW7UPF6_9ACTN|nr:septum formation family protein [Streptomyces pathocidini]
MNSQLLKRGLAGAAVTALAAFGMLGAITGWLSSPPGLGSGTLLTNWTVGACHDLRQPDETAAAFISDTKDPVDCGSPHTTETFQVVKLTGKLAEEKERPSSILLQREGEKICSADKFDKYLGVTKRDAVRGLGMIRFFPSAEEWQNGDRRVRCDVIAGRDKNNNLPVFDGPLQNIYTEGDASAWRVCRNGTSEVFCNEPHTLELVYPWLLFGPDQIKKGRAFMTKVAMELCTPEISRYIGEPIDKRKDLRVVVEVPGESTQSAGSRVGHCWVGPAKDGAMLDKSLRNAAKNRSRS